MSTQSIVRTRQEALSALRYKGQSVAGWARNNGFNPDLVRKVLYGKAKGHWGESHKIAVKLQLKEGEIL